MPDPTLLENLTLREAMHRFRAAAGDADMTDVMAGGHAAAFALHDAVHVLFGCDDSLEGEIKVHAWMAFATTAPMAEMHRTVAGREHKSALAGIGHARLLSTWLRMAPSLLSIILRAMRMPAKLPYETLAELVDERVGDLQARFRIRPIV